MDSLTRGGLGWGQTIVDTLIMTYQTSSDNIRIFMALKILAFTNILPRIISEYIIKNAKLFRKIKINVYAKNMP